MQYDKNINNSQLFQLHELLQIFFHFYFKYLLLIICWVFFAKGSLLYKEHFCSLRYHLSYSWIVLITDFVVNFFNFLLSFLSIPVKKKNDFEFWLFKASRLSPFRKLSQHNLPTYIYPIFAFCSTRVCWVNIFLLIYVVVSFVCWEITDMEE